MRSKKMKMDIKIKRAKIRTMIRKRATAGKQQTQHRTKHNTKDPTEISAIIPLDKEKEEGNQKAFGQR